MTLVFFLSLLIDMAEADSHIATVKMTYQMYMLAFARHVKDKVTELAKQCCYGCEIDHANQAHHSCLMMTEMEHFCLYGEKAFKSVIENVSILLDKNIVPEKETIFPLVERIIKAEN